MESTTTRNGAEMNAGTETTKSEQTILTKSVKDNETTNTKRTMPYIVQVLLYLYNMRIPFDTRVGLKNIYYSLERDPISKEILQHMKDFYVFISMTAHASGEYPAPENLEQYQDLELVEFSDDCCSFKPKVIELRNSKESELYKKAVERYKKSHYMGSEEEAEDLGQAKHLEQQCKLELTEKVKREILWIQADPDFYVIPEGCKLENKETYIALELQTLKGYINALCSGSYDIFDGQVAKFGVQYRVIHAYLWTWDFTREDSYSQATEELKKRFEMIVEHRKMVDMDTMGRLKGDALTRAQNLLGNHMKTKVTRKDEVTLLQMVEDFFATQGIEAQPVIPSPDATDLYLQYKQQMGALEILCQSSRISTTQGKTYELRTRYAGDITANS